MVQAFIFCSHMGLHHAGNGEKLLSNFHGANLSYPSGERPLDACPEVIGLIRFSAFVIRPIEELADRTGVRCEGLDFPKKRGNMFKDYTACS